MSDIIVATLYKFVSIEEPQALVEALVNLCDKHEIKGTLLVASEGLNGTIAGHPEGVDAVLNGLREDRRFSDLEARMAPAPRVPFKRMKVRLKKEIVTLKVDGVDPTSQVGRYIHPRQWNALIRDPDVVVIDTRNDYEVELGSFEGAIDPETESFGAFPKFVEERLDPGKHRRVAMFCTGGIRCEKATSLMLKKGFEEVYHLEGGILHYLEEIPEEESLWRGRCFVFDERETVGHEPE